MLGHAGNAGIRNVRSTGDDPQHPRRHFQRRRGRAVATRLAGIFPLVAVIFFGAATTGLVWLNISGAARVGSTLILACLALATGYTARMWRTLHHQRRTA
jgi:hypothetical protein